MAAPNQPLLWTKPLGENADVTAEIPETTPSGTGDLSIEDLFPILTQVPLSAGGIPPKREDMNAVLKLLGEDIFYRQHGGMYAWSIYQAYNVNAIVTYQNTLYKCVQANGASTTAVAPLGNTEYWVPLIDLQNLKAQIDMMGIFNYKRTEDYIEGNVVYYEGNYYKCVKANGASSTVILPIGDESSEEYWGVFTGSGGDDGGTGSDLLSTPAITSPINEATNVNTFTVIEFSNIIAYVETLTITGVQVQITGFSGNWDNPAINETTNSITSYTLQTELNQYTKYRVRIRAITNSVGVFSKWSNVVEFTTGGKAYILAPTITCNEDTTATDDTPSFTLSELQVSAGAPSDTRTGVVAWVEDINGNKIHEFTDQNTLEYTIPIGVLSVDSNYFFKAYEIGYRFGNGETGSLSFRTKAQFAYVNTPLLTSPTAGSQVVIQAGVTLVGSAFGVTDGTDTHASSNWFLGKGTADNFTPILSATNSSDLTTHTFSGGELAAAGVVAGDSLVPQVSYNGATLGASQVSAPFVITARSGYVTPSGRLLYRHESGKGTVLEYNYHNYHRVLLVPDAVYRNNIGVRYFGNTAGISGLFNFEAVPRLSAFNRSNNALYNSLENNVPVYIEGSTQQQSASNYADIGTITDEQMNTLMLPAFNNENSVGQGTIYTGDYKTARDCCNAIIAVVSAPNSAIMACRNLTSIEGVIGGFDLPLMHDLAVIFVESNYFDMLDPTANTYPNWKLGKGSSYRWNFGGNGYSWSCQQSTYGSGSFLLMEKASDLLGAGTTNPYGVLPIHEISTGF